MQKSIDNYVSILYNIVIKSLHPGGLKFSL
nr:MAG TPA: hypothetical protein [Bacteriophage sp.]DAX02566.1 MAG TPA: hypothetical protein [Bacteriophage sp.]